MYYFLYLSSPPCPHPPMWPRLPPLSVPLPPAMPAPPAWPGLARPPYLLAAMELHDLAEDGLLVPLVKAKRAVHINGTEDLDDRQGGGGGIIV